jgi:nitric oxide reductase activation protein
VKKLKRQEEGDCIDIDALIETMIDIKGGVANNDRLYIRRDKRVRDVSVAFLVDLSGSTEGYVDADDNQKTIIDIEKEAVILMIEALESINDEYAVYGFSSYGRKKVDFLAIKDFHERYNDIVKSRIGSMKPLDNTRLAAALRHVTKKISGRESKIKLVIILSDGKPYDMDYGDFKHAQEDTRKALYEMKKNDIHPFCITVDREATEYLKYMFGEISYTIIDDMKRLPERLPAIYKKLTF